jgi:sterol desaturase/sphingolipid hydroxylase (fatty acid hydroxylase superfamily)
MLGLSPRQLASVTAGALLVWPLTFCYKDLAPLDTPNQLRLALLATLGLYWLHVARRLSEPTPEQEAERARRLAKAIPMAGQIGISQRWYEQASALISAGQTMIGTTAALVIVILVAAAAPLSALEWASQTASELWRQLLDTHTEKQLFVHGIAACFFISYYGLGLTFLALDLIRPALLLPFKIQEDFKICWADMAKLMRLSLLNQVLMVVALHAVWPIYEATAGPAAFSAELPSFLTLVTHFVCFLPVADVCFYFPHRLFHANAWLYKHVHSVHHSWQAPISLCSIYAHPLEFLVGNLPVVAAGPLLCGSHITIFWLWALAAVAETGLGHAGWQLPLLSANQDHDYHHSTFIEADGPQNLGVLGVLDHLFGTDRGFSRSWQFLSCDSRYRTPDYPVDKILARPVDPKATASA